MRPPFAPLLAALLAACSGGDASIVDEPYGGPPAYPDRRPRVPAAAGRRGFVSNNNSDSLSVLDLPAAASLGQFPVGLDPVGLDGPHHLAIDPTGAIFVALSYPAPAILPGPQAARAPLKRPGRVLKLAPDDLRPLGEASVDPEPGDIVLSEDGSRLVVTHFDLQKAVDPALDPAARRATLAIADPRTLGQVAPVFLPVCLAPHGVALSRPDGATAFVACYGEDTLAVVDLTDLSRPVERVPLGAKVGAPGAPQVGPYSAVLSPSGGHVAVGTTEGKDTRIFDVASRQVTAVISASQGAHYFAAWAPDGARVFIPTQAPDALLLADPMTGKILDTRYFSPGECPRPHEVTLGGDPPSLFVVCEGDHVGPGKVLVVDPATLATTASVDVGVYPDRLALGPP